MYEIHELSKIYNIGRSPGDRTGFGFFCDSRCRISVNYGAQRLRQIHAVAADGLIDRPTSGKILFDGKDVTNLPEGERAKLRLNYLGLRFSGIRAAGRTDDIAEMCTCPV